MKHLPRFAVGTIQPGVCRHAAVASLLAALHHAGDSPILFRSTLATTPCDLSKSLLGRECRHLDSWAMSRSDAISALSRAGDARDTVIVEGEFDSALRPAAVHANAPAPLARDAASSLDRLCEWLDLPRIAVVNLPHLAKHGLLQRPQRLDGLLLDGVADPYDAAYWQTTLEALWKVPVLGWLPQTQAIGLQPLKPMLRLDGLRQLAARATPLAFEPEAWLLQSASQKFRVAVALDDAFCGYYPESLDLLEAAGGEICDFSPLKSEALPDNCAVVYFGCGRLEHHAEALAANHCLLESLRTFAFGGGRIYAEGGGLAYLCRELVLPCGRATTMSGLLPAAAHWLGHHTAAEPTELKIATSSWLSPADVSLRGYRHTGWRIEPCGPLLAYAAASEQRLDLLGRDNVIGSRVLINLAANRHLLRRFVEPYSPLSAALRRGRP